MHWRKDHREPGTSGLIEDEKSSQMVRFGRHGHSVILAETHAICNLR